MKTATAVTLLLLLAPAMSARAAEPERFYLRGSLGFGTQALADVNHDIALDAAATRAQAASLRWEPFGNAVPIGLEAGFQLSQAWSGGLGLTWQKNSLEHFAGLDFVDSGVSYVGAQVEEQELQLFDLYGTAAFWIPRTPGLHLGGQLGIAWGTLDRSTGKDLDGDDGSYFASAGAGRADARAVSAGVYLGYEVAATPILGLSARLGYLHCDLGAMEGLYRFGGAFDGGRYRGWVNGPVRNSDGGPMDFDFSGLRASGAVTLRFGGAGGR